ncbi:MAG TPA: hypothetical protein PLR25_16065, partial [Planctomycetaceae bacterium]|nr:hypothetical protein [Planctomycetaceae bacterium]
WADGPGYWNGWAFGPKTLAEILLGFCTKWRCPTKDMPKVLTTFATNCGIEACEEPREFNA